MFKYDLPDKIVNLQALFIFAYIGMEFAFSAWISSFSNSYAKLPMD